MRILEKAPPIEEWSGHFKCKKCHSFISVDFADIEPIQYLDFFEKEEAWTKCGHCSLFTRIEIPYTVGIVIGERGQAIRQEQLRKKQEITDEYWRKFRENSWEVTKGVSVCFCASAWFVAFIYTVFR